MVVIVEGVHNLFQPQHRLILQELSLDWFSHWLAVYKDAKPAKAEQYNRWDEMHSARLAK